ncbi:MAG: response regulator transcription factor [Planctomycetes bacterium]|nr:response regulator transcription factor [Planctomycetota bacterium]
MLAKTNKFQSCVAYARSVALESSRQQTRHSGGAQSPFPRHVLIVEFRDEIYASLSRVLEDEGLTVSRAEKASEVAAMSSGTSRDIVLINEAMPDESGWLISAKLRLSNTPRRLWMYTAKKLYCLQEWQELAGVEHSFCYGGDLLRLILALRAQINLQSKLDQKSAARNKVSTPSLGAFSTNFSGLAPRFAG